MPEGSGGPLPPLDAGVIGPPQHFVEFSIDVACRRVLEHSELQEYTLNTVYLY